LKNKGGKNMKEEKTLVKINEKLWEEFSELGLKLKKAFELQSRFNYIEAFEYIEEAYEHYRRVKKLLNESRRVKVKLEED